jgi:histidinol-phosphate aminotransferase
MTLEFASRIRRIPVYPAADAYAMTGDVAMLASNESPFQPLGPVIEAAAQAMAGLNRYPDPTSGKLRAALSSRYDLSPNRIAVGNGSVDILLAAGEALLEPGAELVYAWPSFSVYPHLGAAAGARAIQVPLDDAFNHDLDAMRAEITAATRLVIVCNPNNPTSTALPLEAYCEFNVLDDPDASVDLVRRHSNVVLLRTFSKVYGLAGLRAGFALCGSEDFRIAVNQVRQPFFLNAAAQAAATEALRHQDEVARRVERTIAERMAVEDELRDMGLQPAQSQANFVWFDLPEGVEEPEVVRGLAAQGVFVRAGTALGREGALRVTIGTEAENRRFLDALRSLI